MVKSPMEYFGDQSFAMESGGDKSVTPAEQAFLKKYLGIDGQEALQAMPEAAARSAGLLTVSAAPPPAPAMAAAPLAPAAPPVSLEAGLREADSVSLVSFFVCKKRFAIPIDAVQEVILFEPPFRLPMAPAYVPGVINLRSHVTPIINLADILLLPEEKGDGCKGDHFIICNCQGLQVGLMVNKIHTMYRAGQHQLNWNVEGQLGEGAEFLSGLLEMEEKLLPIVSVERIVDNLIGN